MRGQECLTRTRERVCDTVDVEHRIDPGRHIERHSETGRTGHSLRDQFLNQSVNLTIFSIVHRTVRVEERSTRQRQEPGGRVRDMVEIVGESAWVGNVLKLCANSGIEGEYVLVCLVDGVYLVSDCNKGRRTYLDEAESRDLGLDEEPADGRVSDPDAL